MKYLLTLLLIFPLLAEGEEEEVPVVDDPCTQTCEEGQTIVSLLVGQGGLQCFCSTQTAVDEHEIEVTEDMIPMEGSA